MRMKDMKESATVANEWNTTGGAGALLPYIALTSAVLLWGGSFSAMRVSVAGLGPTGVMCCRMLLGLVILLPFAKRLLQVEYRRGDWRLLLPASLLQPCLYFLLESHALQFTTSSQAGIIAASVPLLVAAGAALTLGERLSPRSMLGLALSVGGVVSLTLAGESAADASNPILGNSLEFGAMICASAQMLLIKKLSSRYNPWSLTGLQTLAGAIFFLPGLRAVVQAGPALLEWDMLGPLLFLGGPVTIGAFGLFNWGISRIPASHASTFVNLVPVAAVAIGWSVLGEGLTMVQCLFGSVVFAGVWLAQSGRATGRVAESAGS